MSEANIWQPRTILEIATDTKAVEEQFTATAGQSVFVLNNFTYTVNTGALRVHRNGLLLTKGVDWAEASSTTFVVTVTQTAGDIIVASGLAGITGNVDVRDTDIYIANYQAIRDYAGTEITIYAQGKVTHADTGEAFFSFVTGAAPGFHVDNNDTTLVPTGGDGSTGWLKAVTSDVNSDKRYGPMFTTTAAMTAASPLGAGGLSVDITAGMIVFTQGFTAVADGGGAEYLVVAGDSSNGFDRLLNDNGTTSVLQGVPAPKQIGANVDGVTDDRSFLVRLDALGEVALPVGTYLVSSSLTLTNKVTFEVGAIIKLDAAVILTFSNDGLAGTGRVFDLDAAGSAVGNLKSVQLEWFAGHLINTDTNSQPLIQKAYDACITEGEVLWGVGYYSTDGSATIDVIKGQQTIGKGRFTSVLRFTTANTTGWEVTVHPAASFRNIGTLLKSFAVIPTSGTVLRIVASLTDVSDFIIRGCFIGMEYSNCVACKATNFEVQDAMELGVHNINVNDNYFDTFIVSAVSDYITMTAVTGTFAVGETVTGGTSGATGVVLEVSIVGTLYRIQVSNINFTASETLTGGTSGATGTFSSQQPPHRLGGLRLAEKVEAAIFVNGDIIGGVFAVTTSAAVNGLGTRPAYNRFTNMYFDSADSGCNFDAAVAFKFMGCWFSNRPGNGCNLEVVDGFSFVGCEFINSWQSGLLINTSASNVTVTGCTVAGNNAGAGTDNGINIAGGVSDFVIQGNRVGGTLGFGTQNRGILVNAGASDRYIIADNIVSGNTVAGVTDSGSGGNKRVADNY